jgi:hypothetical protein
MSPSRTAIQARGPKPPTKSWFDLKRGPFERTLVDQMRGLRPVVDEFRQAAARGRPLSCLDVGCAEGLIGMEMAKAGASAVLGVEIVPQRVADATRLRGDLPCTYEVGNVATYQPRRPYDVLLALSILHKLPSPSESLYRLVHSFCRRLVVIRLPPGNGPVVIDPRSENVPHDLDQVLRDLGFNLEHEATGYLDEYIGIWRAK